MSGPRLLAISLSCHEPVNRAPFREIGALGIPVHLVVPRRHFVGGTWRDTPDFPPENYELTLLDLSGTNQRTHTLKGLQAVVDAFGPNASAIVRLGVVVRQAKQVAPHARLWSLTAENMPQSLGIDLKKAAETRNPAGIASALVKAWLRRSARRRVDRVLTLSADGTALIEAMGLTATQVPLGFDPRLFRPLPEAREAGATDSGVSYTPRVAPDDRLLRAPDPRKGHPSADRRARPHPRPRLAVPDRRFHRHLGLCRAASGADRAAEPSRPGDLLRIEA